MKARRYLISMVFVGTSVGWIMGYYASSTWWSILVLVCIVISLALILRLAITSREISGPKKKPTKKTIK